MSETFDELIGEMHGTFTYWCVSGCLVVLVLRDNGISAVRWTGTGARMPGDGVEREVAEVTAWPRVGEKLQLLFGDGGRLTSTEVRRIARFEAADILRSSLQNETEEHA